MNDEIERPRRIAARQLAVAEKVSVFVVPHQDSGKTSSASLTQVQPVVIVEGAGSVGETSCLEERDDFIDARGVHMALDIEGSHVVRVPS